jgi:hypothetical protein
MKTDECKTIRNLSDIECGQVYGGVIINHGPTEPPQPFPPIVLKGPIKPQPDPGPVPFPGPNPFAG